MGTVAATCDEPAPAESEEEEAPAAKSELEIYFELPNIGNTNTWMTHPNTVPISRLVVLIS